MCNEVNQWARKWADGALDAISMLPALDWLAISQSAQRFLEPRMGNNTKLGLLRGNFQFRSALLENGQHHCG